MTIDLVREAATHFIAPSEIQDIRTLGNGLINYTYRISSNIPGNSVVLQAINTEVFKSPESIVYNYETVFNFLKEHANSVTIPAPVRNTEGTLVWTDQHANYWRATRLVDHSYTPQMIADEKEAFRVANVFGHFTRALNGIPVDQLEEIIPGFHNLSERYQRFEEILPEAPIERLLQSTHLIAELRERKKLLQFYQSLSNRSDFPKRVMHHDCKISNILFDERTGAVICPVDLDTLMPGLFFSDIGDMIRTIPGTVNEDSVLWEEIEIRPSYYKAVIEGYLDSMGDILTEREKQSIHYSGLLIIFMQALRFLTDFLQGDTYYKTVYPGQNLNRALNQLILLEKLEALLREKYFFQPYQ